MPKTFKCGCVIDKLNFDNIRFDCPAVWDMIGQGLTRGVFQLESNIGRKWSKRVKPQNILELADVISLIRPGCLQADYRENEDNPGKFFNITETYVKVKNKELKPFYVHESLKPILESTYSCLIYQEQLMRICTDFAGFTLNEADEMRKATGKKLPELMKKLESKFIESAIKNGREEGIARLIFSWILEFADYSFNLSHAVSYAINGYQTAYAKCHFPVQFFKAMLTNSEGTTDELVEIKHMVNEAKLWNIKVLSPKLSLANKDFSVDNGTIVFGLCHIKGVGTNAFSSVKKISKCKDYLELFRSIFVDGVKVNSRVMDSLIKAGAMDYLYKDRVGLLKLYKFLNTLTDREVKFIFENIKPDSKSPLSEAIQALLSSNIPRGARKDTIKTDIENIKNELGGNPYKMKIAWEKFLLGMALSGSEVDIYQNPQVNMTCKNFLKLPEGTYGKLGVVIDSLRRHKDKNDNMMAFLEVSDNTYALDTVVVFSRTFTKFGWILEEGKPLLCIGKKKGDSFIVDKFEHL